MSGGSLRNVVQTASLAAPQMFGSNVVALGVASKTASAIDAAMTENKAPEMTQMAPPPTMADQTTQTQEQMRVKTYGRAGTIKNPGGYKGLSSSLLNVSSPSLVGK